jgi:ribosomal subunit interface protein
MNTMSILCKDFDLTATIREYAEEKMFALNKYLPQHGDTASFHLRLGKVSNSHNSGKIFYAEISIKTPAKNFGAIVESIEILSAIDELKDELTHIITSYKDRVRTKSLQTARKFKKFNVDNTACLHYSES